MYKITKKIITTLAILSMIGSAVSFPVSAVSYDPCDVDHDGKVDVLDVITINKYLNGHVTYQNYHQLDANQNLIVDACDADCVMAKIVGLSYSANFYSREGNKTLSFPTVPSVPVLNGVSGSRQPREYRVYSYTSKKELSSYSLTPNREGLDTYTIQGADDRIPANGLNENTGIVRLGVGGTGFIVGDHVIATAGHCVYDRGNAEKGKPAHFVENMTIQTYGIDGKLTGKRLTAVEAHVYTEYISTGNIKSDYALITVKEDLSSYFQFELGTAYNTTYYNFENIPIYVTGCPAKINVIDPETNKGDTNTANVLYTDEGRVNKNDKEILCYNTDANGGDSGAPVYTLTRSQIGSNEEIDTATVLAIHKGGYLESHNVGSLITNYHLQFYKNNPNINY